MAKHTIKYRALHIGGRVLLYLSMLAVGGTMILPLVWMISTSLKDPQAVFTMPPEWIPQPITFQNYKDVWEVVPFAKFFWNSFVVAIAVTFGQVATSACAAFAFARLRFPFREPLFFAYLATLMIPGAVTMIPTFILMKLFGWIDTYRAMIIPGIFTAFGTFLLRQFFMSLPKSCEEAATIDGASVYRIFWSIGLPLAAPALAALTIGTFMGNWQSFMWPLLVIDSVEKKTLPIGLAYFQELYQHSAPNWPLLMTGSLLALLPIVLLYIFTQRFFLQGIRLSGEK